MSDSRAAILSRIRSGRAGQPESPAAPPVAPVPAGVPKRTALVDRFVQEAEGVGAVVHRATRDGAIDLVGRLLVDAGVRRLVSWEPDDLPIPEALDAAVDRGIQLVEPSLPDGVEPLDRDWTTMAAADAGLTGAAGGLADTGTVILRSGLGRARLTWLLPPLHLVLLHAPFIYPTLPAFISARGELVGRSSHVAFVTGPSRTADIEQTLTIGVHGPKVVQIVLVERDREPAPESVAGDRIDG